VNTRTRSLKLIFRERRRKIEKTMPEVNVLYEISRIVT
jgi:hypothetical protein